MLCKDGFSKRPVGGRHVELLRPPLVRTSLELARKMLRSLELIRALGLVQMVGTLNPLGVLPHPFVPFALVDANITCFGFLSHSRISSHKSQTIVLRVRVRRV